MKNFFVALSLVFCLALFSCNSSQSGLSGSAPAPDKKEEVFTEDITLKGALKKTHTDYNMAVVLVCSSEDKSLFHIASLLISLAENYCPFYISKIKYSVSNEEEIAEFVVVSNRKTLETLTKKYNSYVRENKKNFNYLKLIDTKPKKEVYSQENISKLLTVFYTFPGNIDFLSLKGDYYYVNYVITETSQEEVDEKIKEIKALSLLTESKIV